MIFAVGLVFGLLVVPLDVWTLPFRAIGLLWRGTGAALAWPVLALIRGMSDKS